MPARGVTGNRHVEIKGLDELLAKLRPDLYEQSAKQALKAISEAAAGSARAGAPRLTGKLRGSIQPKTNPGPKPGWAVVKVGALSPQRYSYPKLLEFSPRHHHRDWLKNAVERAKGAFESALGKAASEIERKFGG